MTEYDPAKWQDDKRQQDAEREKVVCAGCGEQKD
jgi:hypothetical protein